MTTKKVSIECVVVQVGRGHYRAHCVGASGACLEGSGPTAREAREDLGAQLAWTAHCEPDVVRDGEGAAWLLYPWGPPETWVARRMRDDGISQGSTHFPAANFTAARRTIEAWNLPQGGASC